MSVQTLPCQPSPSPVDTLPDPFAGIDETARTLVRAVRRRDATTTHPLLAGLTRTQLEALAVVLSAQIAGDEDTVTNTALRTAAMFKINPRGIAGQDPKTREAADAHAVAVYASRLLGVPLGRIADELNQSAGYVTAAYTRASTTERLRRLARQTAEAYGWRE